MCAASIKSAQEPHQFSVLAVHLIQKRSCLARETVAGGIVLTFALVYGEIRLFGLVAASESASSTQEKDVPQQRRHVQ